MRITLRPCTKLSLRLPLFNVRLSLYDKPATSVEPLSVNVDPRSVEASSERVVTVAVATVPVVPPANVSTGLEV